MHIEDLCRLIDIQIKNFNNIYNKTFTVGGSNFSKVSLLELTEICQKITNNKIKIGRVAQTSNYDIPYFVTDNSKVYKTYGWKVKKNIFDITHDIYNWLSNNKKIIKKYF